MLLSPIGTVGAGECEKPTENQVVVDDAYVSEQQQVVNRHTEQLNVVHETELLPKSGQYFSENVIVPIFLFVGKKHS